MRHVRRRPGSVGRGARETLTPAPPVLRYDARMLRSTGEFLVKVGGVEICVEALGERADAPVLLIQGACASMVRWEDGFCERIVAGGRYAIRYDNRDVGRSTAYPPGNPPYDLEDLAEDCRRDGRYSFLFTSAPINLPRGVASPPNALALK